MLELVVRVVLSLGVVLGLLWLVARTGSRKLGGRDRGLVRVRSRQSLSRGSSLAVVEVGSRVLVVGVSDGGVRLLTEMDPDELDGAPGTGSVTASDTTGDTGAASRATSGPRLVQRVEAESLDAGFEAAFATATVTRGTSEAGIPEARTPTMTASRESGALGGSLLAVSTWRQAWQSATSRPQRPPGRHAA